MKKCFIIFVLSVGILFSQDISKDLKIGIENLKSKDPLKRVYGAYKIGKLNEDISGSIPYLINILEDERQVSDNIIGKTSPSEEAKKVLIKIGSISIPYIIEKFNDESSSKLLKLKLIEIIGKIEDEKGLIFLEKLTCEKDREIKEKAIEILSFNKNEVDFLLNFLKTQDDYIKLKVITGFGKGKIKEALPFLYECLKDKNWEIRKYSVWAIGEIGEIEDIKVLIPLIKDKEYLVRKEIAEAFRKIKSPNSVSYLIELLDDTNWMVKVVSIKALREIKDERAIEPIINAIYDKQIEVKIEAIRTLGVFKDKRATIPIIICLNDKNPLIKEISAYALGEIKDKRAVYPLINLLGDKNPEIRKISLESLKKITGVNFGYEKEKWYNWALQNRISTIAEN